VRYQTFDIQFLVTMDQFLHHQVLDPKNEDHYNHDNYLYLVRIDRVFDYLKYHILHRLQDRSLIVDEFTFT
jgi:hypothetical protein